MTIGFELYQDKVLMAFAHHLLLAENEQAFVTIFCCSNSWQSIVGNVPTGIGTDIIKITYK